MADIREPVAGHAAGIRFLRRPATSGARRLRLVCLHGIGSSAESFRPLLPHLPADLEIIAWHAPGYGGSKPLAKEWPQATDYADALLRWLDALSIERPVILGHSLGTLIAASFAARYPERVAAVILAAAASGHGQPVGGPLSEAAQQRLADLDAEGAQRFAERRAPRLLHDPDGPARAEVVRQMAAVRRPGYAQAVRMLASGRLVDDLRQVTAPAALVWGAGDVVTPREQTDAAAAALGGAPVHEIERAGHALHAEAPEAFADALLRAIDTMRIEQ